MALGLTRPLIEMSTRNISWGVKAAGAYGRQPYHLHVPTDLKSGSLNRLEPSGPVQACNGIVLPFFIAKIKEGEMGGERSTHLDDDKKYAIVRNNGDCHLGNPGVDGGKR
jgi:hypothetical protein